MNESHIYISYSRTKSQNCYYLKKKIAISYYYDDYYTEVLSRLIQFTFHDNI